MITKQFIHIKHLLRKREKYAIRKEWKQHLETETTDMQILELLYQFSSMYSFVNVCSAAFVFLLRKH